MTTHIGVAVILVGVFSVGTAEVIVIPPPTGSPIAVAPISKLIALDGVERDSFGHDVDVSGSIAIVGDGLNDGAGRDAGAAYLFNVQTGQQLAKLTPSTSRTNSHYGEDVAIDGTIAIVGTEWGEAAYIYDFSDLQSIQGTRIVSTDNASGDGFGTSVDVSGNLAIVGANGDDGTGDFDGAAYIFDVTTGSQIHKLLPKVRGAYENFGWQVAIDGDLAAVTTIRTNLGGGQFDTGAVYLFDVLSGDQLVRLTAPTTSTNFALSLDMRANRVIVGWGESAAVFDTNTSDLLYIFQQDSNVTSVAINDRFAAVGTIDTLTDPGTTQVYALQTGQLVRRFFANDTLAADGFGASVAMSDHLLVVGATRGDGRQVDSGAAYAFFVVPEPISATMFVAACLLLISCRASIGKFQ